MHSAISGVHYLYKMGTSIHIHMGIRNSDAVPHCVSPGLISIHMYMGNSKTADEIYLYV